MRLERFWRVSILPRPSLKLSDGVGSLKFLDPANENVFVEKKKRSKAGGYAWGRYRKKVFPWLYLALFLCFLWPVLAFVFLLSMETDLKTALLAVLLFLVPLYLIHRQINSVTNLRWENGARGEILVGKELEKLHKEAFHVFHDYYSEGRGNVDHFMVGTSGIFAIETKAWKGEITFENDRFLVDGKPTTMKDPIKQVKGEAKDIYELVRKSCGMSPFVRPVLCFSKGELRHYEAVRGVEVTNVGSLNRTIMQLAQRIPDDHRLSLSQVRVISQRLREHLGELPAAAPGSPPEEPSRLQRALKSGGFFVACYLFFTFLVSVIFAGSTAQFLEDLAELYRLVELL